MPHPLIKSSNEGPSLGGEAEKKIRQLKREIDRVEDFDRKVALEETLDALVSLVESKISVLQKRANPSPSPAMNPAQKDAMAALQAAQEDDSKSNEDPRD